MLEETFASFASLSLRTILCGQKGHRRRRSSVDRFVGTPVLSFCWIKSVLRLQWSYQNYLKFVSKSYRIPKSWARFTDICKDDRARSFRKAGLGFFSRMSHLHQHCMRELFTRWRTHFSFLSLFCFVYSTEIDGDITNARVQTVGTTCWMFRVRLRCTTWCKMVACVCARGHVRYLSPR